MATQGTMSPFLCHDAIKQVFKWRRNGIKKFTQQFSAILDQPVVDLVKSNFAAIYQLSVQSGTRLVIIEKQNNHMKRLLVDLRHHQDISFTKNVLYWLIDINTKELLLQTQDPNRLPKVIEQHKSETFQLFPDGENPQTLDELRTTCSKYNLLKNTHVWFQVCFSNNCLMPWLIEEHNFEPPKYEVVAYCKSDLTIGYRFKEKVKKNKKTFMPGWMLQDEEDDIPTLEHANRRSSVNVKLTGLNLALCLNVINHEEFKAISLALSRTCGAIWLSFDDQNHPRHIVYLDSCNHEFKADFKCNDAIYTDLQWNQFFNAVEKAAEILKNKKTDILYPIMSKLEPFVKSRFSNPFEKCFKQLKLIINKHRIFTFCDDDQSLHAIKGPLAGWLGKKNAKKYGKGVSLKTMANYSVTALYSPTFVYINLSTYFNYKMSTFNHTKDDAVLWELGQQWHSLEDSSLEWPSPIIKHSATTLKHQPKVNGTPMLTYLKTRGLRNTNLIIHLWESFTEYYMTSFNYDVSSSLHTSTSQVAFNIVWNRMREKSGPLCHALEQMHPHTEYILRPFCKGGFSYSCMDKVFQGEPLAEGMEIASSIKEFDLTSSYGFSGKSMSAAKGFGVSFSPEYGRTGNRHVSFEYMATMYAIYKMMQVKPIHSVYSNYSPLGTFCVGKYPIDLVVIFQDTSIELIQFDGHYVHGHYSDPTCMPDQDSYVNGKTRQECEAKTETRDKHITNWMVRMNSFRTPTSQLHYSVIRDCCSKNFSRQKLKEAFNTIPELHQLVSGMDKLNGSLDCLDLQDYTFFAIVKGKCLQVPNHLGPIFSTNHLHPTMSEGRMLLTSDYYAYLKKEFAFQVESIEWIIYYKRCHVLPTVFEELLQLRQQNANIKSKSGIVKSIINYACGYFGLNSDKTVKTVARVSHRGPQRFNMFVHQVEPLKEVCNGFDILIIKTFKKPNAKKYLSVMPFVLFVGIVEYGKLRLNQALQCLQTYMRPTSFRLLYSNVDNLVFAQSTDTFKEAFRHPHMQIPFEFESSEFFGSEPGQLKLEWEMNSSTGWKFVSPMKMFYSVTAENNDMQGFSKTCAYKGLDNSEAFQVALNKLHHISVYIEQMRRVDKLANTAMKPVVYKC